MINILLAGIILYFVESILLGSLNVSSWPLAERKFTLVLWAVISLIIVIVPSDKS